VLLAGNVGKIVRLYEEKMKVVRRLKDILGEDGVKKALSDGHSKRVPRPCGLTIHTGIGCDYACVYCYIYDMGFPGKVKPYPLKPYELVYAVASNPYVLPEKTLAAYGSVTEPFHPLTKDLAVKYIEEVYKWLKLPSQVSTKSFIDEDLADKLKVAEPNLNILISISTIDKAALLEPRAPEPIKRFEGALTAIRKGLEVTLFIRPVIPGVTDREIEKILDKALEHGIRGVVFGSLRVTRNILIRLQSKGINIEEIKSRIPKALRDREQVAINEKDIKNILVRKALEKGMIVYPSACSANIYSHKQFCNMCNFGPCGDPRNWDKVSEEDIRDYLEFRGLKICEIYVDENNGIYIETDQSKVPKDVIIHIAYASRLKTYVKHRHT